MSGFDSLPPFEKCVLTLLWRIARNTCPLLPDNLKSTGPPPRALIEEFEAEAAQAKPKPTVRKPPRKKAAPRRSVEV